MKDEKLRFICPECLDIKTQKEIDIEVEKQGSIGMCYCLFNKDRQYVEYEKFNKRDWKVWKQAQQELIWLIERQNISSDINDTLVIAGDTWNEIKQKVEDLK